MRSFFKLPAARDGLPRDTSLFSGRSLACSRGEAIFKTMALKQVISPELPAMIRPMGMHVGGGRMLEDASDAVMDADMRALFAAHQVADELTSAGMNPGAKIPGFVRESAVRQLQALRAKVAERMQADAHRYPLECAAALAAESATPQSSGASTTTSVANQRIVNAVRRRRRIKELIEELEAQVRPMVAKKSATSVSAAAAAAAASSDDLPSESALHKQLHKLAAKHAAKRLGAEQEKVLEMQLAMRELRLLNGLKRQMQKQKVELQAQLRVAERSANGKGKAKANVSIDGDTAAEPETIETLNRNARKPRAANKGKRPVSRAARRLKNPKATRVSG